MAERMVSMEVRLAIAAFDMVNRGGELCVAEACVDLGVSRDTFYRYRARFAAEGGGVAVAVFAAEDQSAADAAAGRGAGGPHPARAA
jgi:hypothetical protein